MAAIKPHLALPDEVTDTEARYWQCLSEQDELGRIDPAHIDDHDVLCPTPDAVLDQTHSGLMNVVYTREVLLEQLGDAVITPRYRGREVALFIDRPVRGPVWNPMLEVSSTKILSWTTKMGAPSFSLPAGAPQMGGACPGAIAGQSIVPDVDRRNQAKRLLPVLYGPQSRGKQISLANTICEHCYAEGGQYATGSVQYHQLVRFVWARRAILMDMQGRPESDPARTAFVAVMKDAIDRVDFKLAEEPAQWRGMRFFRLHDSGDFFDTKYLQCWKAIADYYHPSNHDDPIIFWAPSRIWARGVASVESLERINGPVNGEPTNLVVRPSAYETNAQGPELYDGDEGGWAAPTTVYADVALDQGQGVTYDWNCRAYAVEAEAHSCRAAESPADDTGTPGGPVGCRACWVFPKLRVNYTLHTR